MAKLKENKVLKAIQAFLRVQGSEVDKLIEKKNEFSNDENFGLIWILTQLIKTKQSSLLGSTAEEEMLVRQWLEYASIYLCHLGNLSSNDTRTILKELNDVLSDRVFLARNNFTLADLVFYYMVHTTVGKLSLLEKEKYIHLSRWFSHIQQDKRIRQSNSLLVFSRNILFG